MRKLTLLMWLAWITMPAFANKRVTTDQLEKIVAADHGKQDAKVAQQLANLELSERLSASKLTHWEADLPGPESRQALVALADASAFLNPPPSEMPATVPPVVAAQRQIVALAVDYASKTISRLPDFFATRDTIRFEDTPPRQLDTGSLADAGSVSGSFTPYQPLHPVARSSDTVFYRDGKEVVDSEANKVQQSESAASGLTTWGEFGPILTTVLVDAAQGTMGWSHWEQGAGGPTGPIAVFSYAVPKAKSHYEVHYCCVQKDNQNRLFKQLAGYHGEVAIDPANGTILRLTVAAELGKSDPITKANMLVEYGPVEIGGATYICPLKSVSISLAHEQDAHSIHMQRMSATRVDQNNQNSEKPLQTMLDEVAFEKYHLFRAESSILAGDAADAGSSPPASNPASAKDSGSPAPAPGTFASGPVTAASAETGAPVAPSPAATPSVPVQPTVMETADPEISVAESTGLPKPASDAGSERGAGFTLHVTTRLVDVGVVALDKKGHPVTDLKPEDFEIYDNGRKQTVRFFSGASGASGEGSANAPGQQGQAPDEPFFSNRRAEIADAKPGNGATEGMVTILLIDPGNLAWADLTYARAEMLRFLRALPANALVGLYVMNLHGFQVLQEGTADHALLGSKLNQWLPSAQDLARAQELEQRSRQQFDYVLNPGDLQSVNGNTNMGPDNTASPVDPQLRENGSNPGRVAMPILAAVARHLAAIPGHKDLVWVTSDNVLADWTDKAVGVDQGDKRIDGFVKHVQEVMNDAHVSVYPLDASQLETGAEDPGLQTRNVELSRSVTAPPGPQSGGAAPGRITAEMQQNMHPIQPAVLQMAEATGGRVFRRSGDIATNLNKVVADGRAAYLLGFTPDTPADDQFHLLTVNLPGRRGVTLRYRTGYEYAKEPASLKERFQQAIWQPVDLSEIAVSANPVAASEGATLKLNIATNDVALKQQGDVWADKLDIFLIQRDDEGLRARVSGQTLTLKLKAATYRKLVKDGIPFDQFVKEKPETGSLRIVVVDENSGRMGSVTIPSAILKGKS
jgi:VWFA-related protein